MEAYRTRAYRIINNEILARELAAEELVKFDSRQSYLEWVESWKDFYKSLATKQREIRLELKKPHSTLPYFGAGLMGERQMNKWYLRILLEARRIGKRRSWEMKQDAMKKV